jgi:hypothetical protein
MTNHYLFIPYSRDYSIDEVTPSFPAVDGPQRLAACSTDPKSKRRIKFALAPGHSPLDWARLTNSGKDLRVRYHPDF